MVRTSPAPALELVCASPPRPMVAGLVQLAGGLDR